MPAEFGQPPRRLCSINITLIRYFIAAVTMPTVELELVGYSSDASPCCDFFKSLPVFVEHREPPLSRLLDSEHPRNRSVDYRANLLRLWHQIQNDAAYATAFPAATKHF
jgi:hypothetical protein